MWVVRRWIWSSLFRCLMKGALILLVIMKAIFRVWGISWLKRRCLVLRSLLVRLSLKSIIVLLWACLRRRKVLMRSWIINWEKRLEKCRIWISTIILRNCRRKSIRRYRSLGIGLRIRRFLWCLLLRSIVILIPNFVNFWWVRLIICLGIWSFSIRASISIRGLLILSCSFLRFLESICRLFCLCSITLMKASIRSIIMRKWWRRREKALRNRNRKRRRLCLRRKSIMWI